MNSLLSLLLRSGGDILRDSAELFIGKALVRAATQRLKGILFFYATLSLFALASLTFFYILIYRGVALLIGDVGAAAVLFGANLLVIVVMLVARAILKARAPATPVSPVLDLIKAQVATASAGNFGAGMQIGDQIGKAIRKATPQIAIAAVVVGLAISLLRRRQPPAK